MSLLITIKPDDGGAPAVFDRTTAAIGRTEDAAEAAQASMAKLGATAQQAGQQTAAGMGAANESFADATAIYQRAGAMLERIKQPLTDLNNDFLAAQLLFQSNRLAANEYEAELARLEARQKQLYEASLAPQMKLEQQMYEAITTPLRRYEQELEALASLLEKNEINLEQYDAALAKVQKRAEAAGAIAPSQGPAFDPTRAGLSENPIAGPAFDPNQAGRGMTEELRRQEELLRRLNAPMQEYEQRLQDLDALLKRGAIDEETFNRELDKAAKNAGKGLGPVQGPVQQTVTAGGSGGLEPQLGEGAVTRVTGAIGGILAAGGIVALGDQIEGLVTKWHDIEDVAIRATNAVQRFSDANHSVSVVMDEQFALAERLHASYSQTVALYGRLAESADALKLSEGELQQLTSEFGEAVQISGKSIDAADGIMRRFAYGLAAGKIETREMRSIMREVPAIADLWTKSFGVTRDQLMLMVKDGRVSTEDLMRALLNGGQAIDQQFQKLRLTNQQIKEEWTETEKILSQRYDVAFGLGHAAQQTVDALKKNQDALNLALGAGGQVGDLAKIAQQQLGEETHAALANFFNDLTNLTGVFRPLGDAYRKWTGDTAAVRAEVTKLNEPVAAAKTEIETLSKAFSTGQIDVDTFNKRYNELLTTINHGIGSQAFKILDPIRIAKAELDRLNNEVEAGANITQAQYRKASEQLQTAIHGGVTPEDLKLNNPVLNAKDQLTDLNRAQKEGKITSEAYRREYDALMTTINDGRLPEVIKIWESIHLPIEQAQRDFAALSVLWRSGRLEVEQYTAELKKISDTHLSTDAAILEAGVAELNKRWDAGQLSLRGYDDELRRVTASYAELHKTASGITYQVLPNLHVSGGNVSGGTGIDILTPDLRKTIEQYQSPGHGGSSDFAEMSNAQLERANALANEFVAPAVKYEAKLKDINAALALNGITEDQATAARRRAKDTLNQENEALEAQKGPMEQYTSALKKLNDQLEAGDISQKQFAQGVDKARIAMLEATGAAQTFKGALEIDWLKAQQGADSLGASTAKIFEADIGKFNDNFITAITGGGQAAQQTRDQLTKLREEFAKGQISATDYASQQKKLNDQLREQTDVWANISSSFSSFVDGMIQDIERLLIKWAEMQAVKGIVGLFSSGGGATGNVQGLADTGVGLQDIDYTLPGMATGGSFTVGGDGRTDTTHVAFRATRGEQVTVTTPGAYPHQPAPNPQAMAAMMAPPVVQVHNHNYYDKSVGIASIQSPEGQTAVLNVMKANRGAIRSVLGV